MGVVEEIDEASNGVAIINNTVENENNDNIAAKSEKNLKDQVKRENKKKLTDTFKNVKTNNPVKKIISLINPDKIGNFDVYTHCFKKIKEDTEYVNISGTSEITLGQLFLIGQKIVTELNFHFSTISTYNIGNGIKSIVDFLVIFKKNKGMYVTKLFDTSNTTIENIEDLKDHCYEDTDFGLSLYKWDGIKNDYRSFLGINLNMYSIIISTIYKKLEESLNNKEINQEDFDILVADFIGTKMNNFKIYLDRLANYRISNTNQDIILFKSMRDFNTNEKPASKKRETVKKEQIDNVYSNIDNDAVYNNKPQINSHIIKQESTDINIKTLVD